jgi:hypothetical protein
MSPSTVSGLPDLVVVAAIVTAPPRRCPARPVAGECCTVKAPMVTTALPAHTAASSLILPR